MFKKIRWLYCIRLHHEHVIILGKRRLCGGCIKNINLYYLCIYWENFGSYICIGFRVESLNIKTQKLLFVFSYEKDVSLVLNSDSCS